MSKYFVTMRVQFERIYSAKYNHFEYSNIKFQKFLGEIFRNLNNLKTKIKYVHL